MRCEVLRTPIAARQSDGLRGAKRKALESFLDDLAAQGCAALGYRLTGEIVERLCVKHLHGPLRAVVAFAAKDVAWLLLVAPHNREPETDVYETLYRLIGSRPEPGEGRSKPQCCDQETGLPSKVDEDVVDDLVARSRALTRRR